ncbi:hypothetical protein KY285_000955 [Solanum tuberosum]|nr:hypothetical protein KY285_000955 [Solanum tuberosum]
MVNDKWLGIMPHTSINLLPSVGYDHYPVLMEMNEIQHVPIRYFKFLNCWDNHHSSLDIMSAGIERWRAILCGSSTKK